MNRASAENLLLLAISEEMERHPPQVVTEVTAVLTDATCRWLPAIGAREVRREVNRATALGLLDGARPRYDVVGTWASGKRLIVEIDRTHKPYSLAKLRDAKARGEGVLWLRWRGGWRASNVVADVPIIWAHLGAWSTN